MTDEGLVAALAEALTDDVLVPVERGPVLDALLPVVRRVAKQWAAEEMGKAAEEMPMNPRPWEANQLLTLRVAALTATPNHGRNAT